MVAVNAPKSLVGVVKVAVDPLPEIVTVRVPVVQGRHWPALKPLDCGLVTII